MYVTYDNKYIVKTITTQEKLVLLNHLLPAYFDRVMQGESALVRILGVFQVQCVGNYCTNLVVMENASLTGGDHPKYDLKGSVYQRNTKKACIGKDNEFIETEGRLHLTEFDATQLITRVSNDTQILSALGLMDYSLLVTICRGEVPDYVQSHYVYRSSVCGVAYLVAIIDFLQDYDIKKKGETFWKHSIKGVPMNELSSVKPEYYRSRFMDFIEKIK
jgi:hypothetical protein